MTAEVILSVWNILASFFIFLRGRRQRRTEKYDNQETQTDKSFNKVQKEKKPRAAGFVHVASDHFVISCCDIERWTFVVKQTGSGAQQETRPEEALFSGAPPQTAAFIQ